MPVPRIFAIVLNEPNYEIDARILSAYPTRFKYTDTFYLVALDQVAITKEVAEEVGLKGDNRVKESSGVVFKLNSAYSGYTDKSLWEWLGSVSEEA